jgi:UDP-N-acetylglucosamine--N-acetylmuramyl-(pentapeptide) pyrophosphoryl-undecaprenol N-acetylglucosamine transferase
VATLELCYVGESGGIEEALAVQAGIPFRPVATGQIRGREPWVVVRNGLRMARGARQCAALVADYRPDVVFVTGGYVTAPLAWATWRSRSGKSRRRVPLLIYLPDLTPGLAIKWTSRLASGVAVSFPEVAGYFPGKAVVTGYPVRPELVALDRQESRQALGLGKSEDLPVVLVFGGSRGARSINQALVGVLPALLAHAEVLHVSGQSDWPWVAAATEELPSDLRARYRGYPYLHDEMLQALAAADLAVARAGASTLGEFPARGLPSILVPYPYAGQHQHVNADYLARRGAAIVIEDEALPGRLGPTVLEVLATPQRLSEMAQAAASLARPEAAQNIAQLLYQMGGA